jgi:hypothetical protein
MKLVIKLTSHKGTPILIGVESIIDAEEIVQNSSGTMNKDFVGLTKIQSRGAMIETNYVKESVEEIYKLIIDV